ncbi:dynamin family protein [Methyloprofundus sp.]|uniref:dynamin family protein n=1 Tax=Methyloprofundus sp. TaxID=2020875 RepID=UPI003D11C15A
MAEIVAAELDGRDIQLLEKFNRELSADLSFKILCIGDFSSGKSTFINQFLLQENILPAFPKPTTTRPTVIRFGKTLKAHLYFQDGSQEEVCENVAQRLLETVSAGGSDVEKVSHVILESPSAMLQDGIELVDAPGLNDPDAERMKQTFDYLHKADAVLFFLNAQQPWTRYQKLFFEQELLNRQDIDKLFILANYWDQIDNSDRADVLEYLQQQLQASLGLTFSDNVRQNLSSLKILPVSSKTGENSEQVKQTIWKYIADRKFEDVLAIRVQRLNSYIDNHIQSLDKQIILVKQDRKSREKHRIALEAEIADYARQREQFNRNLKQTLKPEFEEYKSTIEDLFEQLIQQIKMMTNQILQNNPDKDEVNLLLSSQLSRLQDNLTREMKSKELRFLENIKDRIEEQKGLIDLPTDSIVNTEDYFLKWDRVANIENLETASVASGAVGIAGILLGAGTFVQSAAAPVVSQGVISVFGGWLFGSTTAATTSSFMAFGLPGIIIGATAVCGAFYFKQKSAQEIMRQLKNSARQIEQSMLEQKDKCIDYIVNNQSQNLEQICIDVDYEINQTYQQKQTELKQIDSIEDQGAQLEALSQKITNMKLEVNP